MRHVLMVLLFGLGSSFVNAEDEEPLAKEYVKFQLEQRFARASYTCSSRSAG